MLTKTAVFKNERGGVSFISSVAEELAHIPIEIHAEIAVPPGVPFWIITTADLPSLEFRDAWELDESAMGEPDGVGGDRTRFDECLAEMRCTFSMEV